MPSKRSLPLDLSGPVPGDPGEPVPIPFQPAPPLPSPARHAYVWAVLAALFFGVVLLTAALSLERAQGVLASPAARLALLAALAVTPLGLALFAAYVVRQGSAIAEEARRTRALADSLAAPGLLAAIEVGRAGEAAAGEIDALRRAAQAARDALVASRAEVADEVRRLGEQAAEAQAAAAALRESLAVERQALGALGAELAAQSASAQAALASQTRLVTDASDLAQAQLGEAEAALAARAADLASAAATAAEAGRTAADDLARQALRIEGAGDAVGEQMRQVEAALNGRRADLLATAAAWREQQEQLAAETESQQARTVAVLQHVCSVRDEVGARAAEAAAAVRGVLADAGGHLNALTAAAESRRAELDASVEAALDRLALSVAEHRRALEGEAAAAVGALSAAAEQALQAASTQAAAITAQMDDLRRRSAEADQALEADFRARIEGARRLQDMLAESAFTAARQADESFEARLNAARRLVEQSAALVEEAGRRSAERLEAGLGVARDSLDQLHAALAAVDARLGALPAEADRRTGEVRAVLEQGSAALLQAARDAADETQAIDQAFQDRVRRNHEMLSEAVRLIGAVAGGPGPAVAPVPARTPASVAPRLQVDAPTITPASVTTPPTPARTRRRLKLTPPAEPVPPEAAAEVAVPADDQTFQDIFEAAGGPPQALAAVEPPSSPPSAAPPLPEPAPAIQPRADEGWTWKELLSAMDEAPLEDEALLDRLLGEIEAMGVDASALLPRAKLDEIAAAWHTGDGEGARLVVGRLAPAAVRRLSRRIATDRALANQVERFVKRYEGLLLDARRSDKEGLAVAALLGSDPGRAWLLLEAAAAEAEGV